MMKFASVLVCLERSLLMPFSQKRREKCVMSCKKFRCLSKAPSERDDQLLYFFKVASTVMATTLIEFTSFLLRGDSGCVGKRWRASSASATSLFDITRYLVLSSVLGVCRQVSFIQSSPGF